MHEIEFSNRSTSRGKPDVTMELKQSVQETEIHVKGYIPIKEHKSRVHLLQNCPLY